MWFSRFFSSRKGKQYSNNFYVPVSPYHHGDLWRDYEHMEALPSAKTSGGYTYVATPRQESVYSKKGESTGLASEFSVKDPSTYDFLGKIKSFSKVIVDNDSRLASGRFESKRYSWGSLDAPVKGSNVSLYMYHHGSIHNTCPMKVSAEFTLSIIDQIEGNHKKKTYTEVFKCAHPGWGRKDFIPLKDFNDPALGFIFNDTCIIEAKVAVLALVK